MAVSIKSKREIEIMREAGKILGTVLNNLSKEIKPGMTTHRIDQLGEEMIRSYGCVPSFLGYQGYPASICVSVNEEIVHGIPSKKRILHEGDIVSMDAGVIYKGYQSDAARTVGVGEISVEAKQLIEVTTQSFFEGIQFAKEGCHLHGAQLHEDPQIPNFTQERRGIKLYEGMTLAIEPMVAAGGYAVKWLDDDWTAITADHSLSAHYENTVLVTKNGPEILSLVEE